MYRLLKEGEVYKEGDEYYGVAGWYFIPSQWIGMKFSHKDENTLSRQKIQVRRWIPRRVKIKKGWHEEGRDGIEVGRSVWVQQEWTPVKWDDEDDPTFHKKVGLDFIDE